MGRKSLRKTRRYEIALAFSRVLSQHGFANATIVAIADEAGLSPGLIHHHFKNKDEILDELLSILIQNFRESLSKTHMEGDVDVYDYINTTLELGIKSDQIAAKCWVGLFAESIRNPSLHRKICLYVSTEIDKIKNLSKSTLNSRDSAALLSFIIGSLIVGNYIPRNLKGFAATSGHKFLSTLSKVK